jgi:hypothetical protein
MIGIRDMILLAGLTLAWVHGTKGRELLCAGPVHSSPELIYRQVFIELFYKRSGGEYFFAEHAFLTGQG